MTVLFAALAAPAQPASATQTQTCGGAKVTISSNAPTVTGTSGRDVILATGTSGQRILAGGGNDIICGSLARDSIFGGDGDDTVFAGAGNDLVDAGNGSDTVDGGIGNDILSGGPGNDMLSGNEGSDTLRGGTGGDLLQGGPAPDIIEPGTGLDSCGPDAADSVRGQCVIDRTGVAISSVQLPATVTAGETLRISWRAIDPSGVANTNLRIGGYSGYVTSWCGFVVVAELISGSKFDGVYQASCAVPANAVNGRYTMFLMAADSFGNVSAWDSTTQFDFTVASGSADASPPAVSELQARATGESVIVRWRATDPAGVAAQSAWLALNVYSFASTLGPYFIYNAAALVLGDATDGIYEQRIDRRTTAPFTPSGTYTVWFTSIDTLGNKSFAQTPVTVTL